MIPDAAAGPGEALDRLVDLARRLRRDCPWDREQDERSIVPHTVEEAYELAEAAHRGDDAKLLDELGDVLFQVVFLSLLLEERAAGSFREVAEGQMAKLIRRHPHVFGDVEAASADAVVERWHAIKRDERGGSAIGDLAETLPALVRARKLQERARRGGLDQRREPGDALESAARRLDRLRDGDGSQAFDEVGAALLELVEAAAGLGVDPELALSAAAEDYRTSVEAGPR